MPVPKHFIGRFCPYRHGRSWRNRQRVPVASRTFEAIRKGIQMLFMTDEPQGSIRPR